MGSVKESKWLYILLSILAAIAFWMSVRQVDDRVNPVRGIPVVTTGERVLTNQGLMIDEISHQTVSLSWKGGWDDISLLNKSNVSVVVDVSRISDPGTYELDYDIQYPPNVATSAISLQSRQPGKIAVTVSEVFSKPFEIHPVLKGSVAAGYQAGEFILQPETVQVSGQSQKLDQIDRVQVVLEQKDLKKSFSGELPLRLLDARGQELDQTGLRFSTDMIYTVLPVSMVKEVPLSVDFVDGGGATAENITYQIEPATITVSGPEEDLLSMDKLSLGSVDLAQIMDSMTKEFPVYLPAEMENVSGITAATVTVSIEGLTTKAVEVSNIELVNVPKGYSAALTTQRRTIVLRGEKKELDKVSPSQIRIVADLSDLSTATGSYNVPVKVYLYSDGDGAVGVIGQNSVVVNLTKK